MPKAKVISDGRKFGALRGKRKQAAIQHVADGKTAEQISDYFKVQMAWVETIMPPPEPPPDPTTTPPPTTTEPPAAAGKAGKTPKVSTT